MKVCIALDLPSREENLELVKKLKGLDIWLKVGLRTFVRDGKEFINALHEIDSGFKIFLDLKLYDIPNTMADAAESIQSLGVDMFNVHASAGRVAMQTVMERVKSFKNPPLVLAVTALTSFDEENFQRVYSEPIEKKATFFAKESFESGLDGVVCSIWESVNIKSATSRDFITLTPGIRPFGESSDDQKRVANLQNAKEQQSDFLVIGRPIYRSSDPKGACEKILANL